MKRSVFTAVLAIVVLCSAAAQEWASSAIEKGFAQAVGFLGAGCVLNSNCAPGFSYGGGLRWTKSINDLAAYVVGAEYNHRGGYWKLDCVDLQGTVMFGRSWFIESGFYVSPILSTDAKAYGWDQLSSVDFGAIFAVGYHIPSVPGLSAAINVHMGLADLSGEKYWPTSYYGYVYQLNIHWGALVAYRVF